MLGGGSNITAWDVLFFLCFLYLLLEYIYRPTWCVHISKDDIFLNMCPVIYSLIQHITKTMCYCKW